MMVLHIIHTSRVPLNVPKRFTGPCGGQLLWYHMARTQDARALSQPRLGPDARKDGDNEPVIRTPTIATAAMKGVTN
jgi:hypothetical protein